MEANDNFFFLTNKIPGIWNEEKYINNGRNFLLGNCSSNFPRNVI